jgi:hypothetical protein
VGALYERVWIFHLDRMNFDFDTAPPLCQDTNPGLFAHDMAARLVYNQASAGLDPKASQYQYASLKSAAETTSKLLYDIDLN